MSVIADKRWNFQNIHKKNFQFVRGRPMEKISLYVIYIHVKTFIISSQSVKMITILFNNIHFVNNVCFQI